jgi:galactokinase
MFLPVAIETKFEIALRADDNRYFLIVSAAESEIDENTISSSKSCSSYQNDEWYELFVCVYFFISLFLIP